MPAVIVLGGPQQIFRLASGINVQTSIDLASVCAGERLSSHWSRQGMPGQRCAATEVCRGMLHRRPSDCASTLAARRSYRDLPVGRDQRPPAGRQLQGGHRRPRGCHRGVCSPSARCQQHGQAGCHAQLLPPPTQLPSPNAAWPLAPWLQMLAGLTGGDKLSFTFTATLVGGAAGPASTTTSLELTAQASALQAKIDGPNGDVLVSAACCCWRRLVGGWKQLQLGPATILIPLATPCPLLRHRAAATWSSVRRAAVTLTTARAARLCATLGRAPPPAPLQGCVCRAAGSCSGQRGALTVLRRSACCSSNWCCSPDCGAGICSMLHRSGHCSSYHRLPPGDQGWCSACRLQLPDCSDGQQGRPHRHCHHHCRAAGASGPGQHSAAHRKDNVRHWMIGVEWCTAQWVGGLIHSARAQPSPDLRCTFVPLLQPLLRWRQRLRQDPPPLGSSQAGAGAG